MGFFGSLFDVLSDVMAEGAAMGMEEQKRRLDELSNYELEREIFNGENDKEAAYLVLMEREEEYYNEKLHDLVGLDSFIRRKYKEQIEEIVEKLQEIDDEDEQIQQCVEHIEYFKKYHEKVLSAIAASRVLYEIGVTYTELKNEDLIIECGIRYLGELYSEMREAEK